MRRMLPLRYAKYQPVIGPVIVLLVLLVLSLTLGNFLWGRLSTVRQELQAEKKRNAALSAKLDILEGLNQGQLESLLSSATAAIPSSDSTLFALSSIRQKAQDRAVSLANLRVIVREETSKKREAKSVEMRFDIQGGLVPTITFLNDLRNTAPLTKVSKIRLSVSGGSVLANVSLLSFWGPLPEKLGKVEDPIETLTGAEEELLTRLSELELPAGRQIVPAPPQGRENPFAF